MSNNIASVFDSNGNSIELATVHSPDQTRIGVEFINTTDDPCYKRIDLDIREARRLANLLNNAIRDVEYSHARP